MTFSGNRTQTDFSLEERPMKQEIIRKLSAAVASSAIKHTIHGDANITDDVSSIRNLMNMNYDIKR